MKPKIYQILAFALGLTALASTATAQSGAKEYRTFTASNGKEVRARLMKVEGPTATLRFSAGQDKPIPISALSLDDQAYIQSWDPAERVREAAKATADSFGLDKFMEAKGYTSAQLTQEGKEIFIDVKLNGTPYTFVFDSGRFLTTVDSSVVNASGAEVYANVEFAKLPGKNGQPESVLACSFKSFSVGGVSMENFEPGFCNLENIGVNAKGMMGADVLQYFDGIADWDSMKLYFKPQKK